MANRIGLDHLTMTGVAPVQFIETPAAAGASSVSLWPQTNDFNPYGLSVVRTFGATRGVN